MAHIKALHENFSELVITNENIALYQALLELDISTFKPIMNEIISGRIDIEDTRKILSNRLYNDNKYKKTERRLSDDSNYKEVITNNLISRLLGDGKNIIKENIVINNNIDHYKQMIAEEYEKEYGIKLSDTDIEDILLIADIIAYQELNYQNISDNNAKNTQLSNANYLSFKPDAKV